MPTLSIAPESRVDGCHGGEDGAEMGEDDFMVGNLGMA